MGIVEAAPNLLLVVEEPLLLSRVPHVQNVFSHASAEHFLEGRLTHRSAPLFQVVQYRGIPVESIRRDGHYVVVRPQVQVPRQADRSQNVANAGDSEYPRKRSQA